MGCSSSRADSHDSAHDDPEYRALFSGTHEDAGAAVYAAGDNPLLERKVIVLGDICVGKSSVCLRFIHNSFPEKHETTIGAAFATASIVLPREPREVASGDDGAEAAGKQAQDTGSATVRLQVFDTCGEERYRAMTRFYFRKSAAAVLVFDVTNRTSFQALDSWATDLLDACPEARIVVAANKVDLVDARQVSAEEAEALCREKGWAYVECSALTGDGVPAVFERVARLCLDASGSV